jgi:hypothetical protein
MRECKGAYLEEEIGSTATSLLPARFLAGWPCRTDLECRLLAGCLFLTDRLPKRAM